MQFHSKDFGDQFLWGVSSSAYQTEGAWLEDGKGPSIWDVFSDIPGKIKGGGNGKTACDFYHRYIQDMILMQFLNIKNFRFSIAWSRLFPAGKGQSNEKGFDYYDELIDFCLQCGIRPWMTLYHWDLPQALEAGGGWTNRDVIHRFSDYVSSCARRFGDRVKDWIVLNEPMAFTGAGYFLGTHAPGRKGLSNFLPAMHHAALCQSIGAQVLKSENRNFNVGTSFSCAPVDPADDSRNSSEAAEKVDVLLNRLFIEPLLGMGYPWNELKVLRQVEKYMHQDDERLLKANLDFIGLQNYTREVVRYNPLMPYLNARLVPASARNVQVTASGWEIYPKSIYRMLKRYGSYPGVKKIIITECGAAFHDELVEGRVDDQPRINYYQQMLEQVLRAKKEGIKVEGFFAWSFTDNFEWAEGFDQRFGLVYIDYLTQKRYVKSSGYWFQSFLHDHAPHLVALT